VNRRAHNASAKRGEGVTDFTPLILTHHITADTVYLSGYLIDPDVIEQALAGNGEGWDEAVERVLEAAEKLPIDNQSEIE